MNLIFIYFLFFLFVSKECDVGDSNLAILTTNAKIQVFTNTYTSPTDGLITNAIDGDSTTQVFNSLQQNFGFTISPEETGQIVKLTQIEIVAAINHTLVPNRQPKYITIYGSEEDSLPDPDSSTKWEKIGQQFTFPDFSSDSETVIMTLPQAATKAYYHYKILMTSKSILYDGTNGIQFSEIQLYGDCYCGFTHYGSISRCSACSNRFYCALCEKEVSSSIDRELPNCNCPAGYYDDISLNDCQVCTNSQCLTCHKIDGTGQEYCDTCQANRIPSSTQPDQCICPDIDGQTGIDNSPASLYCTTCNVTTYTQKFQMNDVNIQLLFPFSISVPDFTGDSSTSSEDLCKYLFKIEDLYQYGDTPACTINNEVIQINFDDYYNIEYDESIEPISGVIKRTGCNDYLKYFIYQGSESYTGTTEIDCTSIRQFSKITGLRVISTEVRNLLFSFIPGTTLIIVGVQLENTETYIYNFDILIVDLNNGETMYYKQFNERIDFLSYSANSDTIVIKVLQEVYTLQPVSLNTLNSFSLRESCVNFGLMDDYLSETYAYCQFSSDFIEVYNHQTGVLVNSIVLDNSYNQSIIAPFYPSSSLTSSSGIGLGLVNFYITSSKQCLQLYDLLNIVLPKTVYITGITHSENPFFLQQINGTDMVVVAFSRVVNITDVYIINVLTGAYSVRTESYCTVSMSLYSKVISTSRIQIILTLTSQGYYKYTLYHQLIFYSDTLLTSVSTNLLSYYQAYTLYTKIFSSYSWNLGKNTIFTDSQIILYFSDIEDLDSNTLLLFGIWTFPLQNIVLVDNGEKGLVGVQCSMYLYDRKKMTQVNDLNEIYDISDVDDNFYLSGDNKQNIIPVYGDNDIFILIYNDQLQSYYKVWKTKFFLFQLSTMTILNPSLGYATYYSYYKNFLSFMAYYLNGKYYLLYTVDIENVTDTQYLQYQIHTIEVNTDQSATPVDFDMLEFYPSVDYILDNNIMVQICYKSITHNKIICAVQSSLASQFIMYNFPDFSKDQLYTVSTDCVKLTTVSIIVESQDKMYFSCQNKNTQKGQIMSFSISDPSQTEVILTSEMSPSYLSIALSYDEDLLSVSEYNSGTLTVIDFTRPTNDMVILELMAGGERTIENQVVLNDNNMVLITSYEFFLVNFQSCRDDPDSCLSCNLDYYLKITSTTSTSDQGNGTLVNPYSQSKQIMQSQYKIQRLKQSIDMNQIEANFIFLADSLSFSFNDQILNIENPDNLRLVFMTEDSSNTQVITATKQFELTGYKQILIKNIELQFDLSSQTVESDSTCGVSISDVQDLVIFQDVQITQILPSGWSLYCKVFDFDSNNKVIIRNFTIKDETFTESLSTPIVNSQSNTYLILNKVQVESNQFVKFVLLKSLGETIILLDDVNITHNIFVTPTSSETISSFNLIEFGSSVIVKNITINYNVFRQLSLFSFVTTDIYSSQYYRFSIVNISYNTFYDYQNGFILNIEYPQKQDIDHELHITDYYQVNNSMINEDTDDSTFYDSFSFTKLGDIEISGALINENCFFYGILSIQYTEDVTIKNLQAFNFENYSLSTTLTPSLISIENFENIYVDQLNIHEITSIDQPLLTISNSDKSQSQFVSNFSVLNSEFNNICLSTSTQYEKLSTIMLETLYYIDLQLQNNTFNNITLTVQELGNVQSSTALLVQAINSNIYIDSCTFDKTVTNNSINYIFALASNFSITSSLFNCSNYYEDILVDSVNTQGGFFNLKVTNLYITNSTFNNSETLMGGVGYIESVSGTLTILVSNSTFTNIYSYDQGSIFYIDRKQNKVVIEVEDSNFKNIFGNVEECVAIYINNQVATKIESIDQSILVNRSNFINIYSLSYGYLFSMLNLNLGMFDLYFTQDQDHLFTSPYLVSQFSDLQYSGFIDCSYCNSEMKNISFTSIDQNALAESTLITSTLLGIYSGSNLLLSNISVTDVKLSIGGILHGQTCYVNSSEIQFIATQIGTSSSSSSSSSTRLLTETSSTSSSSDSSQSPMQFEDSQVQMNNSIFENNYCYGTLCSGGAILLKTSSFQLENITYFNNSAYLGGALGLVDSINYTLIFNSTFEQNQAGYQGGAIYFNQSVDQAFSFNMTNNSFTNNTSEYFGGAIFIQDLEDPDSNQTILLANSTLQLNTALVIGGISYTGTVVKFKNNFIYNNFAELYGNDLFSYPYRFYLIHDDYIQHDVNETNYTIIQQKSGGSLPTMTLQPIDELYQVLAIAPIYEQDLVLRVSISIDSPNYTNSYLSGTTEFEYSISSERGITYSIEDLEIIGVPAGDPITLQLKSGIVRNQTNETISNTFVMNFTVQFRDCGVGEIYSSYSTYTECADCPSGKISFNKHSCEECPDGATCLGGAELELWDGYWREDYENQYVVECKNKKSNCLKGYHVGDDVCSEGHVGALCEECDIEAKHWSEKYSKSGNFVCAKCSKMGYNAFIIVLLAIWCIISLKLGASKNMELENLRVKVLSMKITDKDYQVEKSKLQAQTDILFKILQNYFQIISAVSSFDLPIPEGILATPSATGQPVKQTLYSMDCLLITAKYSIPFLYFRFLIGIILPIIYIVIFASGSFLYDIVKKKPLKVTILITALIFQFIFLQPDLVLQMLQILSCRKIGSSYFIIADMTKKCYTDVFFSYGYLIILPLLLIFMLGVPYFLYKILTKNKNKLLVHDIRVKYGFIYKEYRQKTYYWEFVKMTEKLLIMFFLVYYTEYIKVKGILVFLTIFFYSIFQKIIQPYMYTKFNKIDYISAIICAFTIIIGVFLNENDFNYFVYLAYIILIFINIYFIVILILSIVRSLLLDKQILLKSLVNRFFAKFSFKDKLLNYIDNSQSVRFRWHYLVDKHFGKNQNLALFNIVKPQRLNIKIYPTNQITVNRQRRLNTLKIQEIPRRAKQYKREQNYEEEMEIQTKNDQIKQIDDKDLNAQINEQLEKEIENKRRIQQTLNSKFDYREYYYFNQETNKDRKFQLKRRQQKSVNQTSNPDLPKIQRYSNYQKDYQKTYVQVADVEKLDVEKILQNRKQNLQIDENLDEENSQNDLQQQSDQNEQPKTPQTQIISQDLQSTKQNIPTLAKMENNIGQQSDVLSQNQIQESSRLLQTSSAKVNQSEENKQEQQDYTQHKMISDKADSEIKLSNSQLVESKTDNKIELNQQEVQQDKQGAEQMERQKQKDEEKQIELQKLSEDEKQIQSKEEKQENKEIQQQQQQQQQQQEVQQTQLVQKDQKEISKEVQIDQSKETQKKEQNDAIQTQEQLEQKNQEVQQNQQVIQQQEVEKSKEINKQNEEQKQSDIKIDQNKDEEKIDLKENETNNQNQNEEENDIIIFTEDKPDIQPDIQHKTDLKIEDLDKQE